MYGSSRLGIWRIDTIPTAADLWQIGNYANRRQYELSNHLGNVMAVIGDYVTVENDTIKYPSVFSLNDYYVFGATKRWSGSEGYRYGFNGKENDDEVKGEGNQQDYGMRIYDPRLGKFLSVDPLSQAFPFYTPYQFAGNMPIWATDLDGTEPNIGLPRWLTIPETILTLPKLPSIPVHPVPPIPPAFPTGFSMPQTPTLDPGPYMPVPPVSPPMIRMSMDESGINPNDATTYPTPPFEGEWKVTPIKSGTKGYEKLKDGNATRLENKDGDVLRWHSPDKYHPKGHWDLKRGGNPNNSWENWTPDGIRIPDGKIYGKDFNPGILILTDPSTFPTIQYPSYMDKKYKQQMSEYNSKKADYSKKMQQYRQEMKDYEKKKTEYDKKMQQYYKDNPDMKL